MDVATVSKTIPPPIAPLPKELVVLTEKKKSVCENHVIKLTRVLVVLQILLGRTRGAILY